MEVPNESQKRKLEETTSTEETPKVVEAAAAAEPSAKKAKVDLDLNIQDITPAKIKKQIEYYFSDSNYRRDKWLQEEAAKHPEGFIEIAKIAAFPRLQAMTTDLNVVVELMRSSDRLKVSEDGTFVKRSLPLPAEDNSIQRSIFVKGLPEDVTIDSVEAHFVQYGAVARVNLFRERDTKKPKGEAFVEFETEDAAKAALASEKQEYNGREITVSAKKPMRERSDKKEKKHDRSEEQKQSAAEAEEESRKAKEERTERMKGTILHVTLAGEEGQEFNPDFNKWDVKTVFEEIVAGDVKFIDLGAKQAWARMLTPEAAQKALAEVTANPKEVKGVKFTNTRLLEGDEEKAYIEKVLEEGDRKFGRGGNRRGGRGGRGGSRGGRGRGNRGRGRN